MSRLFGTDGIRALAGEYPLDPATIFKVGKHLVRLGRRNIIVGRDTRASGVWMEKVLQQAIESEGGSATLAGVITTPGISFLSRTVPFDAGVMISASHNPYQDNGIKIFSRQGAKLSDEEEDRLGEALAEDPGRANASSVSDEGQNLTYFQQESVDGYINFLAGTVSVDSLERLRVVLDCANGASFYIGPETFRRMGADVIAINTVPDGRNINSDCGALYPGEMARAVVESGASFGVAFDGDSDRSIFADHEGNLLDGDHVLFILACHLREQKRMNSSVVVTTVMANLGLEIALREKGLQMVRTRVGDRYVLEEMLRGDHALGGEQSGHIIIRDHSPAGDGIQTALKIAQIIIGQEHSLADLAGGLKKYPQVLVNVSVREKVDYSAIPAIKSAIDEVERSLGQRGRVLVRYSGTEPLVRIMLEGKDEGQIKRFADKIAARFNKYLGPDKLITDR